MRRAYSGLDLRGLQVLVDPPAAPGDLATHAFVAEQTESVRSELRSEVIAGQEELRQSLAPNATVNLGSAALFVGPVRPTPPAGIPFLWVQTLNGNVVTMWVGGV